MGCSSGSGSDSETTTWEKETKSIHSRHVCVVLEFPVYLCNLLFRGSWQSFDFAGSFLSCFFSFGHHLVPLLCPGRCLPNPLLCQNLRFLTLLEQNHEARQRCKLNPTYNAPNSFLGFLCRHLSSKPTKVELAINGNYTRINSISDRT